MGINTISNLEEIKNLNILFHTNFCRFLNSNLIPIIKFDKNYNEYTDIMNIILNLIYDPKIKIATSKSGVKRYISTQLSQIKTKKDKDEVCDKIYANNWNFYQASSTFTFD